MLETLRGLVSKVTAERLYIVRFTFQRNLPARYVKNGLEAE